MQDRLRNWARYVRVHKHYFGHCYSIEHRCEHWHNPPESAQIEWLFTQGLITALERASLYDDLPKPRLPAYDLADAVLVEHGWALTPCELSKLAIKLFYVKHLPKLGLARKLKRTDIDNFLLIAEQKVLESVNQVQELIAIGKYPRRDNLIPSYDSRIAA